MLRVRMNRWRFHFRLIGWRTFAVSMSQDWTKLRAYIVPFGLFMLLLGVAEAFNAVFKGHGPLPIAEPLYWIYPLQTIACGAALLLYWKHYSFGRMLRPAAAVAVLAGVAAFVLWIAPQEWLRFEPRLEGFDPTIFADNPALYWSNLGLRFLRLVVVVPLLEEIFWRGFLMRYLIREDFLAVPFGTFNWSSFLAVAGCFGLAHFGPDFVPALMTGVLYNGIACYTKSLNACVFAHALTNLMLGIYIMQTGQWGFW